VEVGKVEAGASADGGWRYGGTTRHGGSFRRRSEENAAATAAGRGGCKESATAVRRGEPSPSQRPDGAGGGCRVRVARGGCFGRRCKRNNPGREGAGFGNWPSGENGSRNVVARGDDRAARSKARQGRPQAHRGAVLMLRSAGRGSSSITDANL